MIMIHIDASFRLHDSIVFPLPRLACRPCTRRLLQETSVLTDERMAEDKELRGDEVSVGVETACNAPQKLFNLLHNFEGLGLLQDVADR